MIVQTFPNVFVDEFGKYIFTNYRRDEVKYYSLQTLPKSIMEEGKGKDWYSVVTFGKVQ